MYIYRRNFFPLLKPFFCNNIVILVIDTNPKSHTIQISDVIARSEATKQSRKSSYSNEIAALPSVARNDSLFLI